MPLIPADAKIRLVTRLRAVSLGDIVNAYHFVNSAAVTLSSSAIRTAFEAWLDAVWDSIAGHVSQGIDPIDLKVDRVVWNAATQRADIAENLYFGPWTMAIPPNNAGELLPLQLAPVINFRTARPQTVGRKYLPPLCEADSTGYGNISAAAVANMALAGADMLLNAVAAGTNFSPGVMSPYSGVHANFWSLVSATPNGVFMTQRRRTLGRGS